MMPATPIWIRRSMSERSLMVQGMTLRPSAFASASDAAVTSRWVGDHTKQAAAATSPGAQPATTTNSQPPRPGRAPGPTSLQGVAVASIDGQADALDLRHDAAHDHKRAPIEGLNADPCG